MNASHKKIMNELIECLNDHIMDDFKDNMIVNVVLHLITLFTKNAETAREIFNTKKILAYIFNKLTPVSENVFDGFERKSGVMPAPEI